MCQNNLKQIGLGIATWAMDSSNKPPWLVPVANAGAMEFSGTGSPVSHFQTMSNELATPKTLTCPADAREAATSFDTLRRENISYFLSMDATMTSPRVISAGDRNLAASGKPVAPGLFALRSNSLITWTKDLHSRVEGYPCGNLLFVDGHVELAQTNANSAVQQQQLATNHLAIP